MNELEKIITGVDLAIEGKKRQLLADKISSKVGIEISEHLRPHLETLSLLLSRVIEKDTQSEIISKLNELNDTLKNHEVVIEI